MSTGAFVAPDPAYTPISNALSAMGWSVFRISFLPLDDDSLRNTSVLVAPARQYFRHLPRGDASFALVLYGEPALIERAFLLGADEYICEPTTLDEVRIRAHRAATGGPHWQGLPGTLGMSGAEARLWAELLSHDGRTVARDALAASAWPDGTPGRPMQPTSRSIDMAISRLRRRVAAHGVHIRCIRGVGYRLDLPNEQSLHF